MLLAYHLHGAVTVRDLINSASLYSAALRVWQRINGRQGTAIAPREDTEPMTEDDLMRLSLIDAAEMAVA